MAKILKVSRPADFSSYIGAPVSPHPLVCVIDYSELSRVPHSLNNYGVYGLFMHTNLDIDLTYGCGRYDYKNGTLICVAPGQIGGKEDDGRFIDLDGWALLFHPDLLHGTGLEKRIKEFTFFDYHVNEALHLTDGEREIVASLMRSIRAETLSSRDAVQDRIIVSLIEALLNYCKRFYDRQFLTRRIENNDILVRFDRLLTECFTGARAEENGIPGLQYFADRLCMSPNYFADVIKRATGDSAGAYIRHYIVRVAKNRLMAGGGIAGVAYSLGFDYPQHFSRMFKKLTGLTPSEYIRSGKC